MIDQSPHASFQRTRGLRPLAAELAIGDALDISERLAELARQRLPRWRERIFAGNALLGEPPMRFDIVRTELLYVPTPRRREYAERVLERLVAPGGLLLICSYGSSRPEGGRAEPLVDEIRGWGLSVHRVDDAASPEHGFVITRVVSVLQAGPAQPPGVAVDGASPRGGAPMRQAS